MSETHGSLRAARERTIDDLCGRFADETLSMSELERRLVKAREARTRAELDALLADLPAAGVPAVATPRSVAGRPGAVPEARPEPAVTESTEARGSTHAAVAVLGGTRRAGRWKPPANVLAIAMMGGVELDFRDAVLGSGTTEINCFAFCGGIDITVPPDVNVETQGFALLGAFEQNAELEAAGGPGAPTLRINGFALMGGVDVKVRERGATKKGRKKR